MKDLDKVWVTVIIAGVIFLIVTIGISFYETYVGVDQTFDKSVTSFDQKILITSGLENHLRN